MLSKLTIAGVAVLATTATATSSAPADRPWLDRQQPPGERAKALLARMNQTEKFAMVHGYGTQPYVGNVVANARLGIPSLNLEDGPQGVADGVRLVTAWPSAMTVTAGWDVALMEQWAAAMGREQRLKGTNVMLGPGVNIARVPVCGRNFEYMGEDPHLANRMAFHSIRGIQSQGVIGCVKHYLNNNQEFHRGSVSEVVGQREERELYLPPFEGAVEAGVGSAMCSYNRINNTYACENPETLTALLKGELGFQGWVMSDWGATHSTVQAANAGLDQEMPGSGFFGKALEDAVSQGKVPQQRVDDMVLRMLTPMFAIGIFDTPQTGNLSVNATSAEHNRLAFQLAAASTVLLKNDRNILPLQKGKLRSIAVSGDQGTVTGGGSGGVVKPYTVTPTEGIYRVVNGAPVRPVQCTFEQNIDYYQPGNPSAHGTSAQDCCAQCTAQPGCNFFTWQPSENTCWFKATNEGRRQSNGLVSGSCAPLPPGAVNVTYATTQDQAVAQAKAADVAIVNVAVTSSEGSDRADLTLGAAQDALVQAVLAVQPNTIVVVRSPGAVLMPWRDQAPAIVEQFMPGQEAGNALAAVLFGEVNPSARLPVSFPKTADDTWIRTQQQYPGVADPQTGDIQAFYTEGLFVGYRWYDQQKLEPLFPFGHGLSYTTFEYGVLKVTGSPTRGTGNVTVSFTVTNSGKSVAGSEVAQLYLAFPQQAEEPPQQLKRFHKTQPLQPGQAETVDFTLTPRDFSIWSVAQSKWQVTPGPYGVRVGASSRDIRLTATVNA